MGRTRYGATNAAIALTITVLAGCGAAEATERQPYAAVVIADGADDSSPKTLTLTVDAVRRLEVTTALVTDPAKIPYAAVVYDKKGKSWVYSNPKERTFIRVPVTIERVRGPVATLSAGLPKGTRVVTRAGIKLYGAETGVGGGR